MVLHDQYDASAFAAYQGLVTDLSDNTNTTIKVALLDASHTPNLDTHSTWGDVSADDISNTAANSTGYTLGGQELTTMTWTEGTNAVTFDADDVTWSSSTIDAGYAVIYDDTPAAGNKYLLQLIDFEGTESSDNGDFTISWDASGIFQHTPRPA